MSQFSEIAEKLIHKKRAFCEEYIKDYHGTNAAIRAGYSQKTAGVKAAQLMREPDVKAYISELTGSIKSERIATATEIQEILTKQVRGEEYEEVVVCNQRGSEVLEKRISPRDRANAAVQLAKLKGMFNNDINIKSDVNISIDTAAVKAEIDSIISDIKSLNGLNE